MGDVWIFSPTGPRRFNALGARSPDATAPVTVSMNGSQIVLRPGSVMDRSSTVEFVHALTGALETAPAVVIDLDVDGTQHALLSCAPFDTSDERWHEPAVDSASEVSVVAAGIIGVSAAGLWWTVDVVHHRFCRSAMPFDPHFVPDDVWTPVVAVWVSSWMLSVLTEDGMFITSPRVEHAPHRCPQPLTAS